MSSSEPERPSGETTGTVVVDTGVFVVALVVALVVGFVKVFVVGSGVVVGCAELVTAVVVEVGSSVVALVAVSSTVLGAWVVAAVVVCSLASVISVQVKDKPAQEVKEIVLTISSVTSSLGPNLVFLWQNSNI